MSTVSHKSNLVKGILYASSTAVLWGFLAIFIKVALNHVDAITLSWFRFVIALFMLLTILYIKDKKKLQIIKKPPLKAILAGAALGINYIGFITGLDKTTASNAQIFIQIGPILLALTGVFIFREKLSKIQLIGFFIAVCGFVLFFNEQLNSLLLEDQENYKLGSLMVIGAALGWACFASLQKSLISMYNPQSLNIIHFLVPCLILLPFIDFSIFSMLSFEAWLIILFLGLNTVLAYGALAESFQYIEANKVAVIITVNPVITIITMSILAYLNVQFVETEVITFIGIIGAVLVISGASLAVSRKPGVPKNKD